MLKKTIIFLGSKPIGYECFNYLLTQSAQLNVSVAGLLTHDRKEFGNEHNLSTLAANFNIPVFNTPDDMPECDIIYSVQYHEILKQHHLQKARQVAVNLHMAPLPEYRGSNQFSFAIVDGKTEFGATIHQMATGIDNGDILFQKRFPIPSGCWVDELYKLTYNASINLFRHTLSHVISGNYSPVPQSLLTGKYGTSLHLRKEMTPLKTINLNWDKEKIERHIRATAMPGFEPPFCIINGEKVYFKRRQNE